MFLQQIASWTTLKYITWIVWALAAATGTVAWDVADGEKAVHQVGHALQPVVLDRIVDGRYAVFLIGPDEEELIIPLVLCAPGRGAGLCTLLARASDEAARSRIEEKLSVLRSRGPRNQPITEATTVD